MSSHLAVWKYLSKCIFRVLESAGFINTILEKSFQHVINSGKP